MKITIELPDEQYDDLMTDLAHLYEDAPKLTQNEFYERVDGIMDKYGVDFTRQGDGNE
jgi:hypothetical protein